MTAVTLTVRVASEKGPGPSISLDAANISNRILIKRVAEILESIPATVRKINFELKPFDEVRPELFVKAKAALDKANTALEKLLHGASLRVTHFYPVGRLFFSVEEEQCIRSLFPSLADYDVIKFEAV